MRGDETYPGSGKYDNYGEAVANTVVNALKGMGLTSLPACYNGKTGEGNTLELKIVGILRLNEQTSTGCLGLYPIG